MQVTFRVPPEGTRHAWVQGLCCGAFAPGHRYNHSGLASCARAPGMTKVGGPMIDRRALLGAGAVVVVAPFSSPSLAQDTYFTDLHDMAKKEGEISWYLTHWRTETAERVGNLFMQTWPGVRCNVVRSTGQVLFQRLIQEFKAKVPVCDVYSSSE